MPWFTRSARIAPVLIVSSIAALLIAARSPGQEPATSGAQPPVAERITSDIYTEPRPKFLQSPECRSTGSRISDATACEVLHSGSGGWAVVNFMIDPTGKPFEIAVTASTGYKALDEMAIKAVEASAFEPGTVNGKPIESSFRVKYRVWEGRGATGARPAFIKSYQALTHAISAGDRAAADEALKQLKVTNLYEDAYLGMVTYFYAKQWGDEKQQLAGLARAINEESGVVHVLPSDLYKSALQVAMQIQLQLRYYVDALDTYKRLEKVGLTGPDAAQFKAAVAQVEKIRTDGSSYAVSGELNDGSWNLRLLKRHFQAQVSQGHIAQIKLRCQRHYIEFAFDPNLQYDLAAKDGDCAIQLIGTPGTQFTLLQF